MPKGCDCCPQLFATQRTESAARRAEPVHGDANRPKALRVHEVAAGSPCLHDIAQPRSAEARHTILRDNQCVTIQRQLATWFKANARVLPWRDPRMTAWQILVSEIMLQQTPAERVAPQFEAWIKRWPTAAALARATPAEVIRQWDRLGYPNRALRLHKTAQVVVRDYAGELPDTYEELVALPGIGDYTASAILAFAHNKRSVVLDTNIRRVIARVWNGQARQGPSISSIEREFAQSLVPSTDKAAAIWSAAIMEFGATICTATKPSCDSCILAKDCAWRLAGYPTGDIKPRTQKFAGTDRQVRGIIMKVLRDSTGSVTQNDLRTLWADHQQLDRALDGLVTDGLVDVTRAGRLRLPQ